MVTDKYGCLRSVYGSVKLSNRKWLWVSWVCLWEGEMNTLSREANCSTLWSVTRKLSDLVLSGTERMLDYSRN